MRYLLLFFLMGCSTPSYLLKQGVGQLKIQWSSIENEKVLKDPKVSEEIKFKIRLIEDAKKYFEHYFSHPSQGIYTQTTFLKSKAVSYLVIASRPDEIKAIEHKFPIVGSVPYLGFYDEEDADEFAADLKEQGLVTWKRPVYAYSTLGYFEDRILSSFFEYDEVELVELVFHEMFHTLFFVKDQVDLNENMASYFADQLINEYFAGNPLLAKYRADAEVGKVFDEKLVEITRELMTEFEKMKPHLTPERANMMTGRFVRELILPLLRDVCMKQLRDQEDCPDQEEKWNQARLAAFMTYQDEQDVLKELALKKQLPLREFLAQVRAWYNEWEKGDQKIEFTDYLRLQLKV
jgi:hypothetical protein